MNPLEHSRVHLLFRSVRRTKSTTPRIHSTVTTYNVKILKHNYQGILSRNFPRDIWREYVGVTETGEDISASSTTVAVTNHS